MATCSLVVFSAVIVGMAAAAEAPRVAVWDPAGRAKSERFTVDTALPGQVAGALKKAGIEAAVLTSEQLIDPAAFSAARFDALFLEGGYYPKAALPAIERFADEGGVVVALASQVPFLIQVEREAGGLWEPTPSKPNFAWQRPDVMRSFGIEYAYVPDKTNLGVEHQPTALWLKYLPEAEPVAATLPSLWVTPADGAEFFALMRSRRADYQDAPASLYIARKGGRLMIVSTSPVYTLGADPALWKTADAALAALARLAADLRHGRAVLTDDLKVAVEKDMPSPEPLRTRHVTGSVEPEGAVPLARWGKFDGSSLELGEPAPEGAARTLPAGGPDQAVPRSLAPGASVTFALPEGARDAKGPLYLRVRGAYTKSGAALKASLGDRTVLNEEFIYTVGSDAGKYTNVPAEFTRLAFIPGGLGGGSLKLENPGREAVYFDAVQVETRPRPAPDMIIGLGDGYNPAALPKDLAADWGPVRASARTNFLGAPDSPHRWQKVDEIVRRALALNGRLHLIAEGTPPWAPVSAERYEEAERARRAHTCVPDPAKYAGIIEELVARYKGQVQLWEVWNEPDIQQFWRGTVPEYIEFFRTVAPRIKEIDPGARLVTGGMAGYNGAFVDALVDAGVLGHADLFGFHPYCGKTAAWDVPLGQVEGHLMSRGVNIEIYSNESGFTYKNSGWFVPPPSYTPEVQRDLLDAAMARALATGLAKLSVFHAGGDPHPFGLIDEQGKPRPAYAVFADYALLGQRGGRRMDAALEREDGRPVRGIYAAAATHDDGSATLVLNPAECAELMLPPDPSTEFDSVAGWTVFFGKAEAAEGRARVTVAEGQDYAGFYRREMLDVSRTPLLEVEVPKCAGSWDLILKTGDKSFKVAEGRGEGTFRADLRDWLGDLEAGEVEVSFRLRGATEIDWLRFAGGPAAESPEADSLPMVVRFPLPRAGRYRATLQAAGAAKPVDLAVHEVEGQTGEQAWGEARFGLRERSVLQIRPEPKSP